MISSTHPVVAEYIWVAGQDTTHDIRSKIRTLTTSAKFDGIPDADFMKEGDFELIDKLAKLFPMWSFDGSSTEQALCCKGKGENTEIYIVPKRAFPHPFPLRHGDAKLRSFVVLCECFLPDQLPLVPTPDNTRSIATKVFDQKPHAKPWFAMEQEYVIMDPKTGRPYKWPADKEMFPAPQGPYYCSNGAAAWGREIAEEHYAACLKIGVRLSGINAEVMPAQWEYQVGPCTGIEGGDHAIVARWLLVRIAGFRGLDVSFHSKPVQGDWNGSGMHTNYSTEAMRVDDGKASGVKAIREAIEKMGPNHQRDLLLYGDDNSHRLTGKHETSNMTTFSSGVGQRNTSIRIPVQTQADGHGYLEDRRPSSSADPYLVTCVLFASTMGLKSDVLDALFNEKQKN